MNAQELDEWLTIARKHGVQQLAINGEQITIVFGYVVPAQREMPARKAFNDEVGQEQPTPKISAIDAALDAVQNPQRLYPEGTPE